MSGDPYEGARFNEGASNRPRTGGGGKGGADGTRAAIESGKYTEVKVRIQEFYADYPTGRIVTRRVTPHFDLEANLTGWRVDALAYRTPEDTLPGTGTSFMAVPGKTPYTNGSELENAETSAWGRAVASVGVAIDKGIATAQEIRAKRGDDDEPPSVPTGPEQKLAEAAAKAAGELQPVSMPAPTAPAPEPAAPVEDTPAPEAPEKPTDATPAPPAPENTPAEAEGKEDATESVPDDLGLVAEAEAILSDVEVSAGITFDEFKRLAREKFIPNGQISTTARELVEKKAIRQMGGVKELSDQERLILLDACIAKGAK